MKLWGGRFTKETDKLVNDFNASISFDKELYKHLETDGTNWISAYDKSVVGKCYDFRIALIFKLRQEELSN